MTKGQLITSSFVSALPAGYAFYFMLMAVLNNLSTMPTILKAACITLLVMAFVVAIFPLYLLVFYGRAAAVAHPGTEAKSTGKKDEKPTGAKPKGKVEFQETMVGESPLDDSETFTIDDEEDVEDLDLSGGSGAADSEEFEFEEFAFDDEEDDQPKKGKKK